MHDARERREQRYKRDLVTYIRFLFAQTVFSSVSVFGVTPFVAIIPSLWFPFVLVFSLFNRLPGSSCLFRPPRYSSYIHADHWLPFLKEENGSTGSCFLPVHRIPFSLPVALLLVTVPPAALSREHPSERRNESEAGG
jgi:hypothetical protein